MEFHNRLTKSQAAQAHNARAKTSRFLFSFEFRLCFSKSGKKTKKSSKVPLFLFDIMSTMHTFRTSIPSNCYFQPPTHKNCMFDPLHLSCLSCKFEHKTLINKKEWIIIYWEKALTIPFWKLPVWCQHKDSYMTFTFTYIITCGENLLYH